MELLLYWVARGVLRVIEALPLLWVARMGRCVGALVYWINVPHRKKALRNLEACFGKEMSRSQLREIAKENFRRIGESFACAAKTSTMDWKDIKARCDISGMDQIPPVKSGEIPQTMVGAIGHFANFELWAHLNKMLPGYQCATTYRGLRQPSLNRLLQSMRNRSGCLFFERRTEAAALKAAMRQPGILLGLLSDQHAGDNGLRIPFLGRDCSTSAAPAIFALRYNCPLHVGLIFRTDLARWRVELSEPIPTHVNGQPRSTIDIMSDVNKAFEAAVRRDPANWFWVHNRWKPRRSKPPQPETSEASSNVSGETAPSQTGKLT